MNVNKLHRLRSLCAAHNAPYKTAHTALTTGTIKSHEAACGLRMVTEKDFKTWLNRKTKTKPSKATFTKTAAGEAR